MSKSRVDYVSASQVNTFLFCPMQYKMIYVDGATKMPPNIYMAYGSAIHKTLAENYKQKIYSKIDLDHNQVIEMFHDFFSAELKSVPESEWGKCSTLGLQGEDMINKYMNTVAPTIQPLYVEKEFKLRLDSIGVTIYGFIDLITEDNVIIDHKCVGATTAGDYTQAYVNKMLQLTMYSLAFRKEFGFEEKALRIDVLKRLTKGAEFKSIETTRNDAHLFGLLQILSVMKHTIEHDIWYCNTQTCGQCLAPAY